MSVVQLDLQKIEQLLNSATNERQRKMYQALLDKAQSQFENSTASSASLTTPSTENQAQTKTIGQTVTKTQAKTTKKKKKKKKATPQSATTSASPAIQSTPPVTERTYVANPTAPLRAPELNSGVASSSTTQLRKEESSVSPQTEPKSQSQEPKQQSDAEPPIFQALGTVIATPYLKGDRLKVAIDEREYDLSCNRGRARQAYMSLFSKLEKNGSKPMLLRVYPQATFDQSDAEPILSFSLVNFSRAREKINNYPKGFILRGIWQYIPDSKSPVITIYRNREQLGFFKRLKGSRQFNFAKPRHIPVVWSATIEPFKYNPSVEKSEQMPRYFVEVRATFKDGLYVVEEMLREPTRKIPRFIKVSKSSATTG